MSTGIQSVDNPLPNKPRQRWLTCLITLALCLGLPPFLLFAWIQIIHLIPAPPLVISKETTYITEPLTAEGHVDYFTALEQYVYPPELATDENGFRDIIRQFGIAGYNFWPNESEEIREFARRQIYEKLGLDPDIPPPLTFPQDPLMIVSDYYREKDESIPLLNFALPWTLKDFPMLADWVKEIDEPLNAIVAAIYKPVFFAPLIVRPESVESGYPQSFTHGLSLEVQMYRNIARIFQGRAGYRTGQGDIDGVIDDRLMIHRLARLTATQGFAIRHFVGNAIEGMAMLIPINISPEFPLTEQQIRRILAGLDALPPRLPVNDIFENERYMALSAVQDVAIAHKRGEEAFAKLWENWIGSLPPNMAHEFTQRTLDWNIVNRRVNEMYDAIHEPLREKVYAAHAPLQTRRLIIPNEADMESIAQRFLTPDDLDMAVADTIFWAHTREIQPLEESIRRSECTENMQRLVLAILLYRLEHSKLPDDNWAEQIKKHLGDVVIGEGAEQYFSCPSNPSAKEETTYALIQYGDDIPLSHETILLVELKTPVALDKAVVSVDGVLELFKSREREPPHPGVINTARQSGAVVGLSSSTLEKELLRLLGGE